MSTPSSRLPSPLVCVVLVMSGLLVLAVVAPNFLNSVQRGRQKRTMGDIRTIATAIESYSIDNGGRYPLAPVDGEAAEASLARLAPLLQPTYVKAVPLTDAWGRAYRVKSDAKTYTITSLTRDGLPDSGTSPGANFSGGTTDFTNDIVFSTGSFYRFPDGTMGSN